MAKTTPIRKRWRLWKPVAVLTILGIGGVVALPWVLGIAPVRAQLVGLANGVLAPGRVELAGASFSWFGPIRLQGLVLRDPAGKAVVTAPTGTLDRGLWQLLTDRPHYGTLTLDGATVDIERKPDGTIDLTDALGAGAETDPAPTPAEPSDGNPNLDFTLKVVQGSLRLRSPELAGPLTAERLDLSLHLPPAPGKVALQIGLANASAGKPESLKVEAEYDYRAEANPDLSVSLEGRSWPLAISEAGVSAQARLDGKLAAHRQAGQWTSQGDARLLTLDAMGPALAGDRLRLDQLAAIWAIHETPEGWAIPKLEVTSPVATLQGQGAIPAAGVPGRLEGRLDLAALAQQLPHLLHLREGLALDQGEVRLRAEATGSAGSERWDVEARTSDLIAREGTRTIALHDPATIAARLTRQGKQVNVERMEVNSAVLNLKGTGDLDRGVQLTGTVDLGGLEAQLHDLIDFAGVELAGWGQLEANYRRDGDSYTSRAVAQVQELKVKGLTSEPIERHSVRLETSVAGPVATGSGLPEGWKDAHLIFQGDADHADVVASHGDEILGWKADLAGGWPLAGSRIQAEGQLAGRWREGLLELDNARVGLKPAASQPPAGAVRLALQGRYETGPGTLVLVPLPGEGSEGISLAPGGLSLSGLGGPIGEMKVNGGLLGDLAAVDWLYAAWSGEPAEGLAGPFDLTVNTHSEPEDRLGFEMKVGLQDLSWPASDGSGRSSWGPITLGAQGVYTTEADRVDLSQLALGSSYGGFTASGRLDDLAGRRLADLKGTWSVEWAAIDPLVASAVEPGAHLRAVPKPFRVRGPLSGDTLTGMLQGLDAELAADLTEARAFGMVVGQAPVVIRCGGGQMTIDPIATTLNGGRLDLRPEVPLNDPAGLTLRLAPGSAIEGAEINDEVSRRVLAYVAPILDQATRVSGRVSVHIDRAEFPLTGAEDRTSVVNGRIQFENVVFGPGPMATELLGLTGRRAPALRLHQPIQLAVADSRVSQQGLAIPISRDAAITLDGSVGFDETLALQAGVPITGAMLGRQADLNQIVGGTKVAVPIGGTLSHPQIDRRALQMAVRQVGRQLLNRGVERGATELLDRISRSNGGSAPPPGSPPAPGAAPASPRDLGRQLEQEALRRFLPGLGGGSRSPGQPRR